MLKQLEKKTTLYLIGTVIFLVCAAINGLGQPKLFDKKMDSQIYRGVKNIGANYGTNLQAETSFFQIFSRENNLSDSESLAQLINQYRGQHGLSPVPFSP